MCCLGTQGVPPSPPAFLAPQCIQELPKCTLAKYNPSGSLIAVAGSPADRDVVIFSVMHRCVAHCYNACVGMSAVCQCHAQVGVHALVQLGVITSRGSVASGLMNKLPAVTCAVICTGRSQGIIPTRQLPRDYAITGTASWSSGQVSTGWSYHPV